MSEAISRDLEGFLVGRQRAVQQKNRTWRQVAADTVLEKTGTQPLETYIERKQAIVAEWVALRPILELCDRWTGYDGGRRHQEPWWRKTSARKQLSAKLKEIFVTSREKR